VEELNTKREPVRLIFTEILAMKEVHAKMVTKNLIHSAFRHRILGEKIDIGSGTPSTHQILFHVSSSFSLP
jgi:hypothetical protein